MPLILQDGAPAAGAWVAGAGAVGIEGDDLPKSFVLTAEYGLNRIYLTTLSSSTLEKRLK